MFINNRAHPTSSLIGPADQGLRYDALSSDENIQTILIIYVRTEKVKRKINFFVSYFLLFLFYHAEYKIKNGY